MGCGGSKSIEVLKNPEDKKKKERFNEDKEREFLEIRDQYQLGMMSRSSVEILADQRQRITDVTKGLEERWIESHFSRMSNNFQNKEARINRRRMSRITSFGHLQNNLTTSQSSSGLPTSLFPDSNQPRDVSEVRHDLFNSKTTSLSPRWWAL